MAPRKFVLIWAVVGLLASAAETVVPKVEACLDIAPVWSGHPVGFCLMTRDKHQFAAFYDAQRQMTVAARTLDSDKWQLTHLPQHVVWDSHNYVTMAIDDDGFIHVSGNMHCVPLVYFRSAKPLDAATIRLAPMVGEKENRCTYPQFLRGPKNELLFTYRDGRSGSGDQIYNVYDLKAQTWKRMLDKPLTDGKGKMNAYFNGPVRGDDGYFHLCWVWRNSGDCASNHDLSYARSKEMLDWERSDGKPLALPITLESGEIVDPVPTKGGIINGNNRIGFDAKGRLIITYHKYDTKGFTQVYNARLEDGQWKTYQTSDWNYRWDFSGGGSIKFEVGVGAMTREKDGALSLSYSHSKYGGGIWRLDEQTLKPIGNITRPPSRPAAIGKVESSFAGMAVKWAEDLGTSGEEGVTYVLRWESLGPNRDEPRPHRFQTQASSGSTS
ncbi:MAG TPA: BNR repeat-containing protein [Planctomycetota bacterium]|jgi:hypothetical protein